MKNPSPSWSENIHPNLCGDMAERMLTTTYEISLFNSLTYEKFLDWSKLKALADEKINNLITKILCEMDRKHCGKKRKCWLPAFSPFPTMFSRDLFFGVVKTRDYMAKGLKLFKIVITIINTI